MARIWVYGDEGFFDSDIEFSTWALDEKALLQLKYKPAKLDGRVYKRHFAESIARRVQAKFEHYGSYEVLDLYEDDIDIVSEHLANKANHRKHRDTSRYYKIRKPNYNASWDMKERRKLTTRSSRRNLNKLEVLAEKDIVRKFRSTFADTETWSIRGSRNLDVRR